MAQAEPIGMKVPLQRPGATSPCSSGSGLDAFEVRCDLPLPLQPDGEDLGDVTEARFESEPDALDGLV